jgi:hypothetical protein
MHDNKDVKCSSNKDGLRRAHMDPYLPQFSQPVRVDSVERRKARQWRWITLFAMSALFMFLLLFVIEDARAAAEEQAAGEVIIYRDVPKRSAIREGYPETPVAINAAQAGQRVSPLDDDGLVEINTQQAADIRTDVSGPAHHPIPGMLEGASQFKPNTHNRSFVNPVMSGVGGMSGVARTTGDMGRHIGSAMSSMHRASPATPAVPAIPGGQR